MIRIFTTASQSFGKKGEDAAASFLRKEGYRVIGRNVSDRFGEIDIVAHKGHVCYFFEVKTGKQGSVISPAENLHSQKIRKFLRSVEYYCLVNKVVEYRVQGIIILQSFDATYTVEILDLT